MSYENYEEALKVGVWRVPDFGTPYERKAPVILAAHRYGYLRWSVPYRLKNSFYNLPKVKVGDTVEIIWRQRKYIYEVYAEGKGEEITDYSADLILYTCEDLTSPVRIFKYARLIRV
jgi:sortase (surface protein transpeptidase)